jgi:hypothetical protein
MVQFKKAQRLLRGTGFSKDALVSAARNLARLARQQAEVGWLKAAIRGIPFRKTNARFEAYLF